MEQLPIWSETFPVRFNAIDKSDTMTLSTVFGFFQDVAVGHAESLGLGREDMARTGQVWILARMSVQVDGRPRYGETVTVRSWPRSWEKLFALRDFDISNSAGDTVIRARSCWIIIDIEKRRPMRPQAIMESIPTNDGLDALSFTPRALEERPSLQKTAENRAMYNDVDYNGHVNNVSYIRWIENSLEPSLLERAKRSRLDINYMTEVHPGEAVGLWSSEIEANSFAFEGKKTGDNQTAFRAELRLFH